MRYIKVLVCGCIAIASVSTAQGQLLKKLKEKAEKAIGSDNSSSTNSTNNGTNGTTPVPGANGNAGSNGANGNDRPGNKTGGGLVTTPPDVNENLASAETAFKNASYGEARYAIQQAILGVELEIGKNILKSLPETIDGLKFKAAQDQVTSTGWGWAGLTIHREYGEGDKRLNFTITNNAAWMQAVNLYLTNPSYGQSTGGEQKWKQTKVKGYRAVIEYDDRTGYKMSVPLGQTSMLVYEGINYANEQAFTTAVNAIDIDSIKKSLGEN